MKKITTLLFTTILFFSFSLQSFASTGVSLTPETPLNDNHLGEIEKIYGIPAEVLRSLNEETINSFQTDVDPEDLSSKTIYVMITEDNSGLSSSKAFTEFEYLKELAKEEASQLSNENSWMRIHLTLISKSSTVGEVSGNFTWLKRPAFRMKDVVGLVVQNGTVINNSANGFYSHSTSQGPSTTYWTSGFKYFIGGVTKTQTLAKPDYPVLTDNMFIRFQIHKNGAEGLFGTYGHQRMSLNVSNPTFELTRSSGKLKPLNFNLGLTYDQFTGYNDTNASWSY